MFQDFYTHKTIRIYTAVMGTLFNDLQVNKGGSNILVPLIYRGGDKSVIKSLENSLSDDETRVQLPLPMMTFKMVDLRYDPNRKTSRLNRIRKAEITEGAVESQYNRVPYTYMYEVSAKTKTLSELFQIVEQVIANFDPHIDIEVRDNPDLLQNSSIRIKLAGVSLDDQVEGDFEVLESHECTFQFELEGYAYKRTFTGKVIEKVTVDFQHLENLSDQYLGETIVEDANV